MTAPHADQLIDGYLARICAAAHDFPAAARDELLDDMRSHIADARARDSQETDATILNILDRLGEPAVLVAEARERLGIKTQQPERPGLLEIAALVLLLFLWPAGVVLLWLSSQWKTRDKIIGSVFSLGGYPGISLIGLVLAGGLLLGAALSLVRLCRTGGTVRLHSRRLRQFAIQRGLGRTDQLIHRGDRAAGRRTNGRHCRPLQLGERRFLVGDVLVESRVRAALEGGGLLPQVLERDMVALVGAPDGGTRIDGAGCGFGQVAGRRLQHDRQAGGRGQRDRSHRLVWRLRGVSRNPAAERDSDYQGE
ncbi:MAG: hypothetical protein E6I56_03370 [Chloroflexi bacterium]|nr:MAG: hypothetical protein E6I56_03370 [Chloroflexota bacterium]